MGQPEGAPEAAGRGRLLVRTALVVAVLLSALWSSLAPIPTVDTWIALACGRHVAAHGVSTVEPFSSASRSPSDQTGGVIARLHPTGWINQNWLTHLLFYRLVQVGGLNALVGWKVAMVLLCATVVWLAARVLGAGFELAAAAAVAACLISRSFLDIRPQMFSNLFAAVILLVFALALRRHPAHAWWTVLLTAVWANVHGGFIAVFLFVGALLVGDVTGRLLPLRSRLLSGRAVPLLIGVLSAAVTVSVVLSPFHLANLTHPLEISLSRDAEAWRTIGEWQPAWDLSNPVGNSLPFFGLLAAFALTLVAWARAWRRPPAPETRKRKPVKPDVGEWWPRLQPSILAVALLASALALKGRRFIPMAVFVVCPLVAALLQETILMRRSPAKQGAGGLARPGLRKWLGAAAAVLVLGIVASWAVEVHDLYLAPSPIGGERDGVFFRMTGGYRRPFDACAFLAANHVSGRAFNFWADGGFLAWCQEPDAASGKPPVQIFIDGRAQAAYELEHYLSYHVFRGGGPVGAAVAERGGSPTRDELGRMAEWLMAELRGRGIFLVVVPEEEFDTPMAQVLNADRRWLPVYLDDRSAVLADGESGPGQRLGAAVLDGSAVFPSPEARDLTLALNLSRSARPEDHRRAVALAGAVLEKFPTQTAVLTLIRAARSDALKERARELVSGYADGFAARREVLRDQAGYLPRLQAAVVGVRFLQGLAESEGRREQAAGFAARSADYQADLDRVWARMH